MLIFACKKEFQPDLVNLPSEHGAIIADHGGDEVEGDGLTILGQKRTNPYAVETIRQAYNVLYNPDLPSLSANHLYVRFLPQNPEDVGDLLRTGSRMGALQIFAGPYLNRL